MYCGTPARSPSDRSASTFRPPATRATHGVRRPTSPSLPAELTTLFRRLRRALPGTYALPGWINAMRRTGMSTTAPRLTEVRVGRQKRCCPHTYRDTATSLPMDSVFRLATTSTWTSTIKGIRRPLGVKGTTVSLQETSGIQGSYIEGLRERWKLDVTSSLQAAS